MARLDTRLESEGAEFLVLGELLLHKIAAYKTYTNMPGYDLVATNPELNTSAKIQVKSRWRTGATSFPIKNLSCDFVVAAFLNRGSVDGRKKVMVPKFYVLPIGILKSLPRKAPWFKVDLNRVENIEHYRDDWSLIATFLKGTAKRGALPHKAAISSLKKP